MIKAHAPISSKYVNQIAEIMNADILTALLENNFFKEYHTFFSRRAVYDRRADLLSIFAKFRIDFHEKNGSQSAISMAITYQYWELTAIMLTSMACSDRVKLAPEFCVAFTDESCWYPELLTTLNNNRGTLAQAFINYAKNIVDVHERRFLVQKVIGRDNVLGVILPSNTGLSLNFLLWRNRVEKNS